MEKQTGATKASIKPPREKLFGAGTLLLSDHEAFNLVGNIVEKGISGDQPMATSSSTPRPSVLPFPVARHRSHGPYWAPKVEESHEEDEVDNDDAMDAMNYDPIARFADPLQKKVKQGMNLSNWRDLLSNGSSDSNIKESEHSLQSHVENQKLIIEDMETSYGESMSDNISLAREIHVKSPSEPMELDRLVEPSSITSSDKDVVKLGNKKFQYTPVCMDYDGTKGRERSKSSQDSISYNRESSTSHRLDVGQKPEFVNLESQIDAENHARLQSMSPDEIAEAQEEIRDKFNPKLLNLLKQRGKEKIGKHNCAKITSGSIDETIFSGRKCVEQSPVRDTNSSPSVMSAAMLDTKTSLSENTAPSVSHGGSGLWDVWSNRVEAVRNLRFSLDGSVIQIDSSYSTGVVENGIAYPGYSADNVAERDFLRTEGNPAAVGYTLKEALALTRSVIPGQRALALYLIASVLKNASQNIHQEHIGDRVNNPDSITNFVDWEAVWAFALGPEPELVLSLRLCLDDNHDSVVLACAKAIQCLLAYDWTEQFFDISDKLAFQEKHLYTAPVFRSKPDTRCGFLHGGFWKYNAKPSSIIADNMAYGKDDKEPTIQDDNFVAVQDVVAGFVRMGILHRLRYILETNPTLPLEECILSILVAIARHSPTCAKAILNCERLFQTVQDRFMLKNKTEDLACQTKSVKLVRVLTQSDNRNCCEFVRSGTFQRMMLHFYEGPSSFNDWLVAGKEHCKLSSQLMVEQLRFWKVCIKYGHCVSYFTYFYPAICFWSNPPTIEKLVEKDVLQEYASVAGEVYLVLGALAEKLPNGNTREDGGTCKDDTSSWCWKDAASVVNTALQWIVSDSGAPLYKLFNEQNGAESQFLGQDWAKSLLWVISAVLHMLSTIIQRATPINSLNAKTAEMRQLLLDLVTMIAHPLINSGFLRFTGSETNTSGSYIEKLCQFKHHADRVTSLASKCCLHSVLRLISSVDHLVSLAKSQGLAISFEGHGLVKEERILDAGLLICSAFEWKNVLCECIESLNSVKHIVQNIERFGRGGPAPGVGIGWGVAGGGFWSLDVLLAQEDARFLVDLFPVSGSEEKAITCQAINCTLEILLSVGPRDKVVAEKALEILLQIPVLKHLNGFLSNLQISWEYKENDLVYFSNILISHFKNMWLCKKIKKPKAEDGISNSLATIHEDDGDTEESDSLSVEWAKQRLPLLSNWLLSPISTTGDGKHRDPTELLEIAKAGIFFLSGIEAMSSSPLQSTPLVWKLHSLSMSLFSGMGLLEEERSRDIFEALQRLYGHHLDEMRSNSNTVLLSFQSEIHDSYSTFIDTLVEQYAAISYGDLAYGRQIAIYLHCSVEAQTRLSAWNSLSNSRVLELLPCLDSFIAQPEGYLKALEDDESLLEAFLKSWVTGALDRAATRSSGTYTIAVHHLSSFIFNHDSREKLILRNKFVKSLLRCYSRKQQHEKMMLDLVQYDCMPSLMQAQALKSSRISERFLILIEACEGNSSLLSIVERLKSACSRD